MKFRGIYRGHVLTQGIFLGDMMSPIKIFSGVICYFLRDIVPCPPFILRLARDITDIEDYHDVAIENPMYQVLYW